MGGWGMEFLKNFTVMTKEKPPAQRGGYLADRWAGYMLQFKTQHTFFWSLDTAQGSICNKYAPGLLKKIIHRYPYYNTHALPDSQLAASVTRSPYPELPFACGYPRHPIHLGI